MISCTIKEKVDLVLTNATLYSIDEDFTSAEAMAVDQGKVVAVGTSEEIRSKYEGETTLDLKGMFVYPGFNDAHCHFNGYGSNLTQYADLRGTQSPEEIYERLKTHYEKFGGNGF